MENVRQLAFRWRYFAVVAEVLIGLTAFFAGWRFVTHDIAAVPQLIPPPLVAPAPPDVLGIPWAPGTTPAPQGDGQTGPWAGLPGGDLFSRFGRDDLRLYREESRVLQILVDGARDYLLRRVLPAVNAAQGR